MMKIRVHFLRLTVIGITLILLPVSSYGADKVTLQLIWKNQFQFAGYYVAKELGFYENAGLDVSVKEFEFGIDEAVGIIYKGYNTQNKSKEALKFEADTLKKLAFERGVPLGHINKYRISQIAQAYLLMGFTHRALKTHALFYSVDNQQ